MVTRREQQGTDDSALAEAKAGRKRAPKTAPTNTADKPKRQKTQKADAAKKHKGKGTEKDTEIEETVEVEVKGEKGGKRPKAKAKAKAAAKAKAKAAAKAKAKAASNKPKETKPELTDRKKKSEDKKTKSEDKKTEDDDGEASLPRTWAGRWTPTEPVALAKFQAIRNVFLNSIAPRVKAPSSLQNSFFKMVNGSFKTLSPNATESDYVACAKKNVELFLAEDHVRT